MGFDLPNETPGQNEPIPEIVAPADLVERWDHCGWTTDNLPVWESFWVGVLGFKKINDGTLSPEMTLHLFGIPCGARVCRYSWGDERMDVEVHVFPSGSLPAIQGFNRYGISHACLHVKDREVFLNILPNDITVHRYKNPKGWDNIFVRDREGNFIEIRTTL